MKITHYYKLVRSTIKMGMLSRAYPFPCWPGDRNHPGKFRGAVLQVRSGKIETIQVHDLGPGTDEVLDELLLIVILGIELGI